MCQLAILTPQIQEAQSELERIKEGDANHVNEGKPEEEETVDGVIVAQTEEKPSEASLPLATEMPTEPTPPALKKKGIPWARVLSLTLLFVFMATVLLAFLVLESELDIPVIRDLRNLPEVQDFKNQRYNPFKASVTKKVNALLD